MPDFFTRQTRGRVSTLDPVDNTLQEESKPFPWENENWERWGWYPFLYESLESAILTLGGANLNFPSWPNINLAWDLESIDLIDPPGGTGAGGGEAEGTFGDDFVQQFCQPVLLAGQCEAAQQTQSDQCQSLLGPCQFMSLAIATAAAGFGEDDFIAEASRIKNNIADGEDTVGNNFANNTGDTKCCSPSNVAFRLEVSWKATLVDAGIFCSPACQCIGWNHGAGLTRIVTFPPSPSFPEGRKIESGVCGAGFSGHGCDSPQADWGFLPRNAARNLQAIAECIKAAMEDPETGCGATCPNCEINIDSLDTIDPFPTP